MEAWIEASLDWLLEFGANLTTLAIYVTIALAAYSYWRRTLGRRRALAERLLTLAPTMQIDYFIEQLGTPAFRSTKGEREDLVWVHPDAFIRAVAEEGTVVVYAITTRTKRFAPTFMRAHTVSQDGQRLEVQLGRSRFSDLPYLPDRIVGAVGARRWGYSEFRYFGNPGGYQTYAYALNQAGWFPPESDGLMRGLVANPNIDTGGHLGDGAIELPEEFGRGPLPCGVQHVRGLRAILGRR